MKLYPKKVLLLLILIEAASCSKPINLDNHVSVKGSWVDIKTGNLVITVLDSKPTSRGVQVTVPYTKLQTLTSHMDQLSESNICDSKGCTSGSSYPTCYGSTVIPLEPREDTDTNRGKPCSSFPSNGTPYAYVSEVDAHILVISTDNNCSVVCSSSSSCNYFESYKGSPYTYCTTVCLFSKINQASCFFRRSKMTSCFNGTVMGGVPNPMSTATGKTLNGEVVKFNNIPYKWYEPGCLEPVNPASRKRRETQNQNTTETPRTNSNNPSYLVSVPCNDAAIISDVNMDAYGVTAYIGFANPSFGLLYINCSGKPIYPGYYGLKPVYQNLVSGVYTFRIYQYAKGKVCQSLSFQDTCGIHNQTYFWPNLDTVCSETTGNQYDAFTTGWICFYGLPYPASMAGGIAFAITLLVIFLFYTMVLIIMALTAKCCKSTKMSKSLDESGKTDSQGVPNQGCICRSCWIGWLTTSFSFRFTFRLFLLFILTPVLLIMAVFFFSLLPIVVLCNCIKPGIFHRWYNLFLSISSRYIIFSLPMITMFARAILTEIKIEAQAFYVFGVKKSQVLPELISYALPISVVVLILLCLLPRFVRTLTFTSAQYLTDLPQGLYKSYEHLLTNYTCEENETKSSWSFSPLVYLVSSIFLILGLMIGFIILYCLWKRVHIVNSKNLLNCCGMTSQTWWSIYSHLIVCHSKRWIKYCLTCNCFFFSVTALMNHECLSSIPRIVSIVNPLEPLYSNVDASPIYNLPNTILGSLDLGAVDYILTMSFMITFLIVLGWILCKAKGRVSSILIILLLASSALGERVSITPSDITMEDGKQVYNKRFDYYTYMSKGAKYDFDLRLEGKVPDRVSIEILSFSQCTPYRSYRYSGPTAKSKTNARVQCGYPGYWSDEDCFNNLFGNTCPTETWAQSTNFRKSGHTSGCSLAQSPSCFSTWCGGCASSKACLIGDGETYKSAGEIKRKIMAKVTFRKGLITFDNDDPYPYCQLSQDVYVGNYLSTPTGYCHSKPDISGTCDTDGGRANVKIPACTPCTVNGYIAHNHTVPGCDTTCSYIRNGTSSCFGSCSPPEYTIVLGTGSLNDNSKDTCFEGDFMVAVSPGEYKINKDCGAYYNGVLVSCTDCTSNVDFLKSKGKICELSECITPLNVKCIKSCHLQECDSGFIQAVVDLSEKVTLGGIQIESEIPINSAIFPACLARDENGIFERNCVPLTVDCTLQDPAYTLRHPNNNSLPVEVLGGDCGFQFIGSGSYHGYALNLINRKISEFLPPLGQPHNFHSVPAGDENFFIVDHCLDVSPQGPSHLNIFVKSIVPIQNELPAIGVSFEQCTLYAYVNLQYKYTGYCTFTSQTSGYFEIEGNIHSVRSGQDIIVLEVCCEDKSGIHEYSDPTGKILYYNFLLYEDPKQLWARTNAIVDSSARGFGIGSLDLGLGLGLGLGLPILIVLIALASYCLCKNKATSALKKVKYHVGKGFSKTHTPYEPSEKTRNGANTSLIKSADKSKVG